MSFSKSEIIDSIYKKYGVRFPETAKERDVLDAFAGKYHRLEVLNIAKRGKPGKFERHDLGSISTGDLKRLAQKYSKVTLPAGLNRDLIIQVLLKKLNPDKLSDKELATFGKKARSSLTGAAALYGGWIPKVRKKIKEGDVGRGRREAGRYKF
jgi:hypothetical protein